MAFLGTTIRADELPESTGGDFAPIPAGEYTVSIAAADLTPTKDGTGRYIKLKLNVIAPTHQGRVLFSNLNIRNQSAKAEEIGLQQLGAVMRAIGLATIEDTDQLIGGTLIAKVDIRTSEQYGAQNEVKAYKPLSGAAPAKPQQAAAQPQQAAVPAKRPW
jgi:hypothetical protein